MKFKKVDVGFLLLMVYILVYDQKVVDLLL